jgi:hypothetical protein
MNQTNSISIQLIIEKLKRKERMMKEERTCAEKIKRRGGWRRREAER